jgi:arylsulfatase A-like enzyme
MAGLREAAMRQRHLIAVLVNLAAVVAMGCAAPKPRHVILIVVDTMRGDHMSCVGGPVKTPNLDALAADGVLFAQARSTAPITGPSHSSLFTGRYVHEHGITNNAQVLADDHVTMAEVAQGHGFATSAFVSLGVLRDVFGFAQGFDHYDHRFDVNWWRNAAEINDAVFEAMDGWVGDTELAQHFLWVHYSDPHEPYTPPDREYPVMQIRAGDDAPWTDVTANGSAYRVQVPLRDGRGQLEFRSADGADHFGRPLRLNFLGSKWDEVSVDSPSLRRAKSPKPTFQFGRPTRFDVSTVDPSRTHVDLSFVLKERLDRDESRLAYRAEVEYVDSQIGRLIRRLKADGVYDDALIVFTADHGEGMGDHDLVGHIHQLYDSLLHVPLIVVAPGLVPAGTVVEEPVTLLDVQPTVADLCGWRLAPGQRGRTLVPVMHSGDGEGEPPLVAQTARPQAEADLVALVDGGMKLIWNRTTDQVELYDLAADPDEVSDLANDRHDDVARMMEWLLGMLDDAGTIGAWADIEDETREQLEALGYVN